MYYPKNMWNENKKTNRLTDKQANRQTEKKNRKSMANRKKQKTNNKKEEKQVSDGPAGGCPWCSFKKSRLLPASEAALRCRHAAARAVARQAGTRMDWEDPLLLLTIAKFSLVSASADSPYTTVGWEKNSETVGSLLEQWCLVPSLSRLIGQKWNLRKENLQILMFGSI